LSRSNHEVSKVDFNLATLKVAFEERNEVDCAADFMKEQRFWNSLIMCPKTAKLRPFLDPVLIIEDYATDKIAGNSISVTLLLGMPILTVSIPF
jgi:hypothetical protein